MWNWVQENSDSITAASNVMMLVVWALYFQLLLNSYKHQMRPKILINRGAGYRLNAKCMITNMSTEPIYVEMVILTLYTEHERNIVCSLSDIEIQMGKEGDPRAQWFQGPLDSGDYMDIGTFNYLIERSVKQQSDYSEEGLPEADINRISVLVAGSYTSQDGIIAAEREFDVQKVDGERILHPRTLVARQIRSTRKRRAIERFIVNELKLAEQAVYGRRHP